VLTPTVPVAEAVGAALGEHLLVAGAGDNVMRLLPPLTVSDTEIAEAMSRLDHTFAHLKKNKT
jgi:acetylornithine/N-succinyldiaminopimelate aminotransferase